MYALATVLTLLAILAIILRFWARRVKKVRPSWDDYLIVFALVLSDVAYRSGVGRLTLFLKISTIGTGVCMVVGQQFPSGFGDRSAELERLGTAAGSLGRHSQVTSEGMPVFDARAEVLLKVSPELQ